MTTNNITKSSRLDEYIRAHDKVVEVMNAPLSTLRELMKDYKDELNDIEYANMLNVAVEYAQLYALRDVMTLREMGMSLEEALNMWKTDDGCLGMKGECENAVYEAYEGLYGDDEWGEDDE